MSRVNNEWPPTQPRYEDDYSSGSERFYRENIYNLEKKLIAHIYEEKGKVEMAQKCLLIPHQSMLYMALNYKDDEEFQDIALTALDLTLPKLMKFAELHPPCERCMKELNAQLALVENNRKTYH